MPGGLDLGLLGFGIGDLHVHFLLGNRLRALQRPPAFGRDDSQPVTGHRHVKIGLGGRILGIQSRRVDGSQDLARLHLGTDILVPHLHITRDLRIDGSLVPGRDIARQVKRAGLGALLRQDDLHARYGRILGYGAQMRDMDATLNDATCHDHGQHNPPQGDVQPPTPGHAWRLVFPCGGHACSPSPVVAAFLDFLEWIRAKTQGTNSSVAQVATSSPPITARPSGAFCELLSDMGSMPMIMLKPS